MGELVGDFHPPRELNAGKRVAEGIVAQAGAVADERRLLAESPVPLGSRWIEHVNAAQTDAEVDSIHRSINHGQPFGGKAWSGKFTRQLQLEHTFRPRGRPKKQPEQ